MPRNIAETGIRAALVGIVSMTMNTGCSPFASFEDSPNPSFAAAERGQIPDSARRLMTDPQLRAWRLTVPETQRVTIQPYAPNLGVWTASSGGVMLRTEPSQDAPEVGRFRRVQTGRKAYATDIIRFFDQNGFITTVWLSLNKIEVPSDFDLNPGNVPGVVVPLERPAFVKEDPSTLTHNGVVDLSLLALPNQPAPVPAEQILWPRPRQAA